MTATSHRPISSPNVLRHLYLLFLREQLTRGRLILAGVLGGLSVFIAFMMARNLGDSATADTIAFIALFGLGLAIPIQALVMASSSLGNLVEDETLVYLWMRPNPRWLLAGAAWLASLTMSMPLIVAPFTLTAAVGSRGDLETTGATALAVLLAVVGYTGLFTFLGLVTRWSLIWGLVYVVIWETIVSRAGAGAARLSVVSYASSVLSRITEEELPQSDRAMASGLVVPFAIAIVAIALTTWRLNKTTVA
ncbi:MAG: hypothetical protein AAFN30_01950 [Actinomycetota bacterium]